MTSLMHPTVFILIVYAIVMQLLADDYTKCCGVPLSTVARLGSGLLTFVTSSPLEGAAKDGKVIW